jgi:endogenous inhibitor of DNA gyrase (YacG/DUF329 family)
MSAKCLICQKIIDNKYRPFCSARCQQVDLHRWFGEVYAMPVVEGHKDDLDSGQGEE